jgi:glycerate dehydrogenase
MERPRIVVLDGFNLNPGDLSWADLAALGELEVYDRSAAEEVVERARGAPILLTNKAPVASASIERLPELRYIGVLATGTNVVDVAAARARGIVVSNVPDYGADSVAEHTLCLMLEGCKKLARHAEAVKMGAWSRQKDFSLSVSPISLLAHKRLGLIGFGAIGSRVAELAGAFKMDVCVARHGSAAKGNAHVTPLELDSLFESSDIISLHCPLTPATQSLVDARRLSQMRRTALLVNTARGGLIDEPALAAALSAGTIAGAYLDVLSVEPPPADHVLLAEPRCFITPHIAWASLEARCRLLEIAVENVRCFLEGRASHVVT